MAAIDVTFEQCKELWDKYEAYKERAEQHEFFKLFLIDRRFIPLYKDLEQNWTPEHGLLFVSALQKVLLDLFGIG